MESLHKEVAEHAKLALFGDTLAGEQLFGREEEEKKKKRSSSVRDIEWKATAGRHSRERSFKSTGGGTAVGDTEESASFKIRLSAGQALLAGSPNYVDPLIVRSERFDETADVFSFGVIMLECLCGMRVSAILSTPGYS